MRKLAPHGLDRHIAPIVNPSRNERRIRAVLGPTNTGKTYLAIERMCAHSSGAMGFPLRLLAREVYDKVRKIKGDAQVALITGEERIEPPHARYLLCTVEAMPRDGGGKAFVALDEAQLAGDRERGHIFTDRLLNARGRDETMILGSSTLEPIVRALIPEASIEERPRFSTLSHIGPRKLSRLPPRSAIVGFSVEQVYQLAEMLRRFRGGAAVVMGALSPETRNRQVELFQSGEVDYIVATDAIGMGLNLDVNHVAFASLSKFDGVRHRRLIPAEMAQIAGRAGRHQTDGTFGTLGGNRKGEASELLDEEVYAIENHRFAPLTKIFWREPEPRFSSLALLLADLERKPTHPTLAPAPEAIDLAVLRRLAEDPSIASKLSNSGHVRRFWEVCQLPDFRQQGPEIHSRFVARLWQDLRVGHIGADFVAARIAELDRVEGDIDTLQGRLSGIRSWSYICQRPDWVLAKDEMAARARTAEARLSDALHQRLTERFVNKRTALLMRGMGKDSGLLRVTLNTDGQVMVEDQPIGHLEGFRFVVDPTAQSEERKLMLAAAEKHLPALLAERADALIQSELGTLTLIDGEVRHDDVVVGVLEAGKTAATPRLVLTRDLSALDAATKARLTEALDVWLAAQLAPLAPLVKLEEASRDPEAGSELRALLLTLLERNGDIQRRDARLDLLPKEKRPMLRKLGVTIGSLDIYTQALLKPAPRRLLNAIKADGRPLREAMEAVLTETPRPPAGYRRAGTQTIRIDMAEKLFRAAHEQRAKGQGRTFIVDVALPTSMGLLPDNFKSLMRDAGFRAEQMAEQAEGAFGPPAPQRWSWRPPRPDQVRSENPRGPRNHAKRDGAQDNRPQNKRDGGPHGKRDGRPGGNFKPKAKEPEIQLNGAFAALAGLLPK